MSFTIQKKDHKMNEEEFLKERRQALEESVEFFTSANKKERERACGAQANRPHRYTGIDT